MTIFDYLAKANSMYSLEKCNFTMQMDEIEYEEEKTCDGGENVNLSEVDQTYSGPLKS